ncbi:hypothetical protein L195_g061952 [Trifolium pratense]|uniref:Uncharacterized protein n=1 Tax=Trifolium pratense TaxID=57577 RepID=A0A2K3KCT4_TRIPR|nr:hypothetical protein L195_g061952 [Trifolium pratense]
MFLSPMWMIPPAAPRDPTVVSEPMVVDPTPCVEILPNKVFRRRVPLRPSNGCTSG